MQRGSRYNFEYPVLFEGNMQWLMKLDKHINKQNSFFYIYREIDWSRHCTDSLKKLAVPIKRGREKGGQALQVVGFVAPCPQSLAQCPASTHEAQTQRKAHFLALKPFPVSQLVMKLGPQPQQQSDFGTWDLMTLNNNHYYWLALVPKGMMTQQQHHQ